MVDLPPRGPLVGAGLMTDRKGKRIRLVNANGPHVIDEDGKQYIDFVLGGGPVIIGHRNPEFIERTKACFEIGLNLPSYSRLHFEYAEHLLDGALSNQCVILFTKSSTEAVAFGLRLITIETGKLGIIRLGYLGQADVAIGRSIIWHEPLNSVFRNPVVLPQGARGIGPTEPVFDWVDYDIESLKKIMSQSSGQIGAMAIDAFQLAVIGEEKFSAILDLCEAHGIFVLLDETKTAGRVSSRGYFDSYTSRVAYTVLGKAIGNGGAISALLGPRDRLDLYRRAKIGSTHSKETFGAACGIAKLEVMQRNNGYERIRNNTAKVVQVINNAIASAGATHLLSAKSYFSDTIFELHFGSELLNDLKRRVFTRQILQENGLLLMDGHCSYICVEHDFLNFEQLFESSRLVCGQVRDL